MSEKRIRIVSTGPTWETAAVLVDGVPIEGVISVNVDITAGEVNTATVMLDCVELDVEVDDLTESRPVYPNPVVDRICHCPWWCYKHPPYASLRGLTPVHMWAYLRARLKR